MNRRFIFLWNGLFMVLAACSSAPPTTPPATVTATATMTATITSTATPVASPIPSATQPRPTLDVANINGNVEPDISYCTADNAALKLDLYVPKFLNTSAPLIVYVHGGAWQTGDKQDWPGVIDLPSMLGSGFIVASVNYRLAPSYKFPAMIEDVKCAIRFLRAHAQDYHIDSDRIGVWGDSAGGHLASLVGVTDQSAGFDVEQYVDQSSRVQAVVDMYGPADLTIGFATGYQQIAQVVFGTTNSGDHTLKVASPTSYISPDDPPFLILHGDRDQVVPVAQSQEFYDSLIAGGVTAKLVVVKGGNHGLDDPQESPSRKEQTALIIQFFKENLK